MLGCRSGFRVLKKIEQIVREEQDRAGAIELLMPTLQLADLWRESGRYDAYGPEMLRIKDRHERELLYGPTNEDMITEIFRAYVRSYRELPKILYHIQWKFRDEQRPRFGVMRGREFLMKDAYSFDIDEAAARVSYNKMFVAYLRTFARMGLKAIPDARRDRSDRRRPQPRIHHPRGDRRSPAVFCNKDVLDLPVPGEDVDYDADLAPHHPALDQRSMRRPSDVHDAARFEREVPAEKRLHTRGIEVGPDLLFRHQIFRADARRGDRSRTAPSGRSTAAPTASACRGWSAPSSRPPTTMPASNGRRRWRRSRSRSSISSRAAPIPMPVCEQLYRDLAGKGVDVLYDDLDERPGAKFATADLIGVPWQVLVGPRGLAEGKVEVKRRADGSRELMSPADALHRLAP